MTVAEASKQASMLPLLVHNVARRMLDPLVVIVVCSSRCTKEESVLQHIVQFVHGHVLPATHGLRGFPVLEALPREHAERPCGGLRVYQHAALYQREGSWSVRCAESKAVHDKPMCVRLTVNKYGYCCCLASTGCVGLFCQKSEKPWDNRTHECDY